jgi:hypothetical protein
MIVFSKSPLIHCPLTSEYMLTCLRPSTETLKYDAGRDCRNVDDGVIGERKERMILVGLSCKLLCSRWYVRLVVDASKEML